MPAPQWSVVADDERYRNGSEEDRKLFRDRYFDNFVAPNFPEERWERLRTSFHASADDYDSRYDATSSEAQKNDTFISRRMTELFGKKTGDYATDLVKGIGETAKNIGAGIAGGVGGAVAVVESQTLPEFQKLREPEFKGVVRDPEDIQATFESTFGNVYDALSTEPDTKTGQFIAEKVLPVFEAGLEEAREFAVGVVEPGGAMGTPAEYTERYLSGAAGPEGTTRRMSPVAAHVKGALYTAAAVVPETLATLFGTKYLTRGGARQALPAGEPEPTWLYTVGGKPPEIKTPGPSHMEGEDLYPGITTKDEQIVALSQELSQRDPFVYREYAESLGADPIQWIKRKRMAKPPWEQFVDGYNEKRAIRDTAKTIGREKWKKMSKQEKALAVHELRNTRYENVVEEIERVNDTMQAHVLHSLRTKIGAAPTVRERAMPNHELELGITPKMLTLSEFRKEFGPNLPDKTIETQYKQYLKGRAGVVEGEFTPIPRRGTEGAKTQLQQWNLMRHEHGVKKVVEQNLQEAAQAGVVFLEERTRYILDKHRTKLGLDDQDKPPAEIPMGNLDPYLTQTKFAAGVRRHEVEEAIATPPEIRTQAQHQLAQQYSSDIRIPDDWEQAAREAYLPGMTVRQFTQTMIDRHGPASIVKGLQFYDTVRTRKQPTIRSIRKRGQYKKNRRGMIEPITDRIPSWDAFWATVGGRSTGPLRKLSARMKENGVNTRALDSILNMIRNPTADEIRSGAGHGGVNDFINSFSQRVGAFNERITRLTAEHGIKWFPGVRGWIRGPLDKNLSRQLRHELASGEAVHPLSLGVRGILDDLYRMAEALGIDVKPYLKGYLPLYWNIGSVKKNHQALSDMLVSKYEWTREAADAEVAELINAGGRMMPERAPLAGLRKYLPAEATEGLDLGNTAPNRKSRIEHRRRLAEVNWEDLEPYIETDVFSILSKYLDDVSRRVTLAEKFGPKNEKLNSLIAQAYVDAEAGGMPMGPQQLRIIDGVLRAFEGTYELIADSKWRNTKAMSLALVNMAVLAKAGLTSIADIVFPTIKAGPVLAARTMPTYLARTLSRSIANSIYRMDPSTRELVLESWNKGFGHAVHERVASLVAGEHHALNTAFFTANLMHSVTRIAHGWSGEIYKGYIERFAKREIKRRERGGLKELTRREHVNQGRFINELGVDVDELVKWYREGANWEALKTDSSLKTGGIRFVNYNVMHGHPADMPLWGSSLGAIKSLLSNVQKFSWMMGNTYMRSWVKDIHAGVHDAVMGSPDGRAQGFYDVGKIAWNTAATFAIGYGISHGIWQLKDLITYGPEGPPEHLKAKRTGPRVAMEVLQTTGFLGWMGNWAESAAAHSLYGREPALQKMGPAMALGAEVFKGTGTYLHSGKVRPLARTIARTTPIANVYRPFREGFAKGIYETMEDLGLAAQPQSRGRKKKVEAITNRLRAMGL